MLMERHISTREQEAETKWKARVAAVADIQDFKDDGHFFEMLDPEERERLVHELAHMPAGSRSVRSAVQIVCPELLDDQKPNQPPQTTRAFGPHV
jgi:hypothetical protein